MEENKSAVNIQLTNEYASIEIGIDNRANGLRLYIMDRKKSRVVYLDPLQIECLTRMDLKGMEDYLPY